MTPDGSNTSQMLACRRHARQRAAAGGSAFGTRDAKSLAPL